MATSHRMFGILYSLFIISYFSYSNAQNITVQSQIIEEETGAPIPYASVYTMENRRGTITDMDGKFELNNVTPNDTIVFYFAGFKKKKLAAKDIKTKVPLEKLEQLLDEVVVLADETIPYKLISKTRKNIKHQDQVAQSYLEMQSFQDNHQLEYFQGYYNGIYDGYDIEDLQLKTARFGLQKTDNFAFLSQETSAAMYKQEIFDDNRYFPDAPFGLNRRKLFRTFRVTMNSKYREQNGDITYVLSFEPRKDTLSAFLGKAWIDSATNILTKVEFSIENASKYPFIPIHKGGELQDVNMHITKTYARTAEGVRLTSMDFDYDFTFEPNGYYNVDNAAVYKFRPPDSVNYEALPSFKIRAEAVLAAYNYSSSFSLPEFDFPTNNLPDYHKMIAFQDHPNFWSCYNQFRMGKSEEKEKFLEDDATVTHNELYEQSDISDKGIYEFPYRQWSTNRIYFRPSSSDTSGTEKPFYNSAFEGTDINARKYHLVAQILFEVDSLCDSVSYRTRTLFDPFQSFYDFERTPRSVAFLNVYFDLMELSRRELNAKLDAVEKPTKEVLTDIYEDHIEKTQANMEVFFREVERGTREEEFLEWNEIVCVELGIDNNWLFSAPKEEEEE
ncbi:MAG: carboxypeptidase-like regulatory domain-containing protein [bacterium]|nr:carboxypeptidase-like regulatory domain-containing protein [bacterium]